MGYFDPAYFSSPYFDTGSATTTLGRHVRGKPHPFPIIDEPQPEQDDTAFIVLMTTGRRHG